MPTAFYLFVIYISYFKEWFLINYIFFSKLEISEPSKANGTAENATSSTNSTGILSSL